MKILCVIDSLGSGGAQRQLVGLAIGFKERGHNVSFLTYHPADFYKEILDDNDIEVKTIIRKNYLKRFIEMRKHIRNGKFDVVLSFLTSSNFTCELSGLPWRNWKLVVGERSANPKVLRSFKLRMYRYFHLLSDYVVANSNESIRIVKKVNQLLPRRKCHIIYNMIDFEKWYPSNNYTIREHGKFRIVVAASHQRLKNLEGLIKGITLLTHEEKSQLVVDWYGDRLSEPYLDESLIKGLEEIKFTGLANTINFHPATINILEKIQQADAVGLFSLYEGCPNIVCEAMACGKPIIASHVSDLPNILDIDRNLLFNPKLPISIANSLKYLINLNSLQLSEIGNANRVKAQNIFLSDKIISKYLDLFK